MRLFYDVDTQHDFMDEDGKLPVPGASGICPNLEALTQYALMHTIPVIGTADAHPEGDPEFSRFGKHCLKGTYGQKRIGETLIQPSATLENRVYSDSHIKEIAAQLVQGKLKAVYLEKQELGGFTNPNTEKLLSALSPDEVVVYGVAAEYCVELAVLGLLERGYRVLIVEDAVKELVEGIGEKSLGEMEAIGAKRIKTAEVLL
jgi:nicotinamidase/pyrazinamidase